MENKKLLIFTLFCIMICITSCSNPGDSVKNHKEFTFYTVGSGGPNARFGTNVYQVLESLRENTGQLDEFLFTIAEEPLTMNQIRERSGLTIF
jgi:hypothetical protein